MRGYTTNVGLQLTNRQPIISRLLFWFTAKDRSTGSPQTIGFWDGDDHQVFTINSIARTYYGVGNILEYEDLVIEPGIKINPWSVTFSGLSPEGQQLLRTYEPRFAPVEVHQVMYNPDTMVMLDSPFQVFSGEINNSSLRMGPNGTSADLVLELVSTARKLTRTLPIRKSDEDYKKRSSDRIGRYMDVTANININWGQ